MRVQILRLSTAHVKIRQIYDVILQQQVGLSWNFASLFSVMTDNSSVIF